MCRQCLRALSARILPNAEDRVFSLLSSNQHVQLFGAYAPCLHACFHAVHHDDNGLKL